MNYVLSQAEDSECPYIDVCIYGFIIKGLFDSGESRIFLAKTGIKIRH